jgi:hypothetical protein
MKEEQEETLPCILCGQDPESTTIFLPDSDDCGEDAYSCECGFIIAGSFEDDISPETRWNIKMRLANERINARILRSTVHRDIESEKD